MNFLKVAVAALAVGPSLVAATGCRVSGYKQCSGSCSGGMCEYRRGKCVCKKPPTPPTECPECKENSDGNCVGVCPSDTDLCTKATGSCGCAPPSCGDGVISAGESCEPPNQAGCDADCQSPKECKGAPVNGKCEGKCSGSNEDCVNDGGECLCATPTCEKKSDDSCAGPCPSGQSCSEGASGCECKAPTCEDGELGSCTGPCPGTGEECVDGTTGCECKAPTCEDGELGSCTGPCPGTNEECVDGATGCECKAPTCEDGELGSCTGPCPGTNEECVDGATGCECKAPVCEDGDLGSCTGPCPGTNEECVDGATGCECKAPTCEEQLDGSCAGPCPGEADCVKGVSGCECAVPDVCELNANGVCEGPCPGTNEDCVDDGAGGCQCAVPPTDECVESPPGSRTCVGVCPDVGGVTPICAYQNGGCTCPTIPQDCETCATAGKPATVELTWSPIGSCPAAAPAGPITAEKGGPIEYNAATGVISIGAGGDKLGSQVDFEYNGVQESIHTSCSAGYGVGTRTFTESEDKKCQGGCEGVDCTGCWIVSASTSDEGIPYCAVTCGGKGGGGKGGKSKKSKTKKNKSK